MSDTVKIYVAGPFFNQEQLDSIMQVENTLDYFDCINMFKPRNAKSAAKKLNADIGAGKDPSAETRHEVYIDNVTNIDDSQLVVALIDGRDIGTIFEIGWAAAKQIPVVTYTNHNFGVNLMLSECVLAHAKGTEQLKNIIQLFIDQTATNCFDHIIFDERFKRANLSETKEADPNLELYKGKENV